MKLDALMSSLLSLEVVAGACVSEIDVGRTNTRNAVWVAARLGDPQGDWLLLLLNAIAPPIAGVLVLSSEGDVFLSEDGFPLQRSSIHAGEIGEFLARWGCPEHHRNTATGQGVDEARVLIRLPDSGAVLDAHALNDVILAETWYGCRIIPEPLSGSSVCIRVGAQTHVTRPRAAAAQPFACWEYNERLFGVFKAGGQRRSIPLAWWHADGTVERGDVPCSTVAGALGVPADRYAGFVLESDLEIDCFGGYRDGGSSIVTEFVKALRNSQGAWTVLGRAMDRMLADAFQKKNRALENRRNQLYERRRVFFGHELGTIEEIAYEPTCENELIILATRLESRIRALMGEFQILEHTSREGIDSVVKLQLAPDAPSKLEFVEFEFQLGNFFTHGHPIRQTSCVVCWSGGGQSDIQAAQARGWGLGPHPDGWSFVLSAPDHMVRVLPLSRLPGLTIVA